ncbi:MAG: RiPP maturation radical SAM C-methyltransferase [Planctomycetota bacterium]
MKAPAIVADNGSSQDRCPDKAKADICLVVMPYAPFRWPSLGVGLLVSGARRAGLSAKAVYANLWFAGTLGYEQYDVFVTHQRLANGLGEWTFAGACFPDFKPDHDAYLSQALETETLLMVFSLLDGQGGPDEVRDRLFRIRQEATQFVDMAAERVLEMRPRIVGCSSTFQQNCASLALLRRIKQLDESVVTIMGGANCEAEMGLAMKRGFPWVDYVVSGEADETFPALCRAILGREGEVEPDDLPVGVFSPSNAETLYERLKREGCPSAPAAIVSNVDDLPVPDYDDYFLEREKCPGFTSENMFLPFEASRGCWKGERDQCRFCGLNGVRRRYRPKASEKVLAELQSARDKYHCRTFLAADSILDMRFFKTLLPTLARTPDEYHLFFETSSMLAERHLKSLAKAGVRWIQPGIETLNEEIVALINKGNSPLHSIALLKFALEQGIWVRWNILYRIPGDDARQYEQMTSIFPLLHHLQPPEIAAVELQRFSCYERDAARYGLTMQPYPAYSYIYAVPNAILGDLAYCLRSPEMDESRNYDWPAYRDMKRAIMEWAKRFWGSMWSRTASHFAPKLLVEEKRCQSVLTDTRRCAREPTITLHALAHKIHRACRAPINLPGIMDRIGRIGSRPVSQAEVEDTLGQLVERNLILSMSDRYLALATHPPQRPLPGKFPQIKQPGPAIWDWLMELETEQTKP